VRYDHTCSKLSFIMGLLTGPREQTAYLVALTSLVKAVPKSTYAHEMPTVSGRRNSYLHL
jgi:hypothetical protein